MALREVWMTKWLKPFVLVAAGIGFLATLQIDVAAADPINRAPKDANRSNLGHG